METSATPTNTLAEIARMDWADRDALAHDVLVMCLEATQPLIAIARFN